MAAEVSACTQTSRGSLLINPAALASWNALKTPLRITPSPVGTKMTSGVLNLFCCKISNPTDFFPSIVKGLNRNTGYHTLTIEKKKCVELEILQQNKFKTPDVILVPTGDGVILSGVFKAFHDAKAAGLINKLPRLVCVQAETSAAIHPFITTGIYRNADRPHRSEER